MSSPIDEPMSSAESGRSDGRGAEEFRNVCECDHLCENACITIIAHINQRVGKLMLLLCCCAAAVIKTKVLSQAKGSAYVEFNNTKVMVGV